MEAQKTPTVPRISFDKIDEDYRAKGIDITDIHNKQGSSIAHGHFQKWLKAKGLPDHDEDGVHFHSSKIFYRQYKQDPEGEAAAPLFVNLWHYLLHISQSIEWTTTENEHTKYAPLAEAVLHVRQPVSEADLERYRQTMGDSLTDEELAYHVENRRIIHLQDLDAREHMREIIETYGVEVPKYGKLLFIEMKVDR